MRFWERPLKAHSDQPDGIFDQLVRIVRTGWPRKKWAIKNFVELGYYRMGRLCAMARKR